MRRSTFRRDFNRNSNRRGSVLVFCMIALLAVSMIGASLLRTSIASMRQLHREQQVQQTSWLADSGCQRAIYRLRTDLEFSGETWIVPAEQLQSHSNGQVQIRVSTDPKMESRRIIQVVAEYPIESLHKTRLSRELSVMLTAQEAK